MRIIAGTNKGRTLKAPKWDGLRPTSDKLRETLFNIIAPHVDGARVLDVFAGTGAIALEALSRGAAAATCIEHDRRAALLIEENRERCGEENRCVIIRDTVERALSKAGDRRTVRHRRARSTRTTTRRSRARCAMPQPSAPRVGCSCSSMRRA